MTGRARLHKKLVTSIQITRARKRSDKFAERLITHLLRWRQLAQWDQRFVVGLFHCEGILQGAGGRSNFSNRTRSKACQRRPGGWVRQSLLRRVLAALNEGIEHLRLGGRFSRKDQFQSAREFSSVMSRSNGLRQRCQERSAGGRI